MTWKLVMNFITMALLMGRHEFVTILMIVGVHECLFTKFISNVVYGLNAMRFIFVQVNPLTR